MQVFFNFKFVSTEEEFFFTMIICDDTIFLQWTPSFIILLCKLIYSFIHIWTASVISCYPVKFLILSDSSMECREHSAINHTWYNVSDFVVESVNYFNESFSRKWFKHQFFQRLRFFKKISLK